MNELPSYLDNSGIIRPLLKDNAHYHFQIIKRKQDGGGGGCLLSRVSSPDTIAKHYSDYSRICAAVGARMYINLTPVDPKKACFTALKKLADYLNSEDYIAFRKVVDHAAGSSPVSCDKRWIVDVDTKDEQILHDLRIFINDLRPEGTKIVTQIPTPNGYHLITKPFDLGVYNSHSKWDVHKNNPTVLFAPLTKET